MGSGEPPHGIDVWIVEIDGVDAPSLARWFEWLTPEEQRKHGRFATEHLQREYLVTRALSRSVLSHYSPSVAPRDWQFERTEAGRPFVVAPCETPSFNLSNTDGLVVCAVSGSLVGIDVEPWTRGGDLLGMASRIFTERENADIALLPTEHRAHRALELWALKEAYLKGRGDGIAVQLNRLGVVRDPVGSRLDPTLGLAGDPASWQLAVNDFDLGRGYVVAVAAQRGGGPDLPIVSRQGLKESGPVG